MATTNKVISNPKTRQEIRFLQTSRDTGGTLLEMESTYYSFSKEPVAHYHPYQEEYFKVISGELTVRINGKVKVLKEGEDFHIPPAVIHAMWNNSNVTTRVNWKVKPAMNTENLLETAMGLANEGTSNEEGMPPFLQLVLMANKYASVFRMSKPPFVIQKIIFSILAPVAILAGYRSNFKKYID